MLNLLHTFYNFNKIKSNINYNNSQLDIELNNYFRQNKNIGSKDRKFLTNIIFVYYRNLFFINKISESVFAKHTSKIETYQNDLTPDELDSQFKNFITYMITLVILENESKFITEMESKYHFFTFNKNLTNVFTHYFDNKNINTETAFIDLLLKEINNEIISFNTNLKSQIDNFDSATNDLDITLLNILEIKFSIPKHIILNIFNSIINENLSILDLVETLDILNKKANVYFRLVNKFDDLKIDFEQNQIEFKNHILSNSFVIDNNSNKKLTDLNSFKNGLFEIQDFSSQVTFQFVKEFILNKIQEFSSSNQTLNIIDTCSGGGGKSLLFADEINILNDENKSKFKYHIYSSDINIDRLKGLNIRLNKSKDLFKNQRNITPKIINSKTNVNNEFNSFFDLAIIDAPCSGIGTIRRDATIKYRVSQENIDNFQQTQVNIINDTTMFLKEDGLILYVTCSLNYDENIAVVETVLNKNKNLKPLNIFTYCDTYIKSLLENKLGTNYNLNSDKNYLTLFPQYFNSDGFFVALLQKV